MPFPKKTTKPKRIPDKLINLANNIYYIQLNHRSINTHAYNNKIKNECLKHAGMVIDIIMKAAKELDSKDKREAFYELMGNNHMIIAEVYMRNIFDFNYAINVLCRNEGLPKLDIEMPSEDVMLKLCELTESKECSRLQRAFDILMKHGDNLIEDIWIKQSNASNLGLSRDDVKSLQLLARTDKWNKEHFIEFLKESIYDSISVTEKPARCSSIYDLYITVLNMAIIYENNQNIEAYKKENLDKIKEFLDEMKNTDKLSIKSRISDSKIFNDIKDNIDYMDHMGHMNYKKYRKYKEFDITKFKTNVINNYLKSIDSHVSIIKGESSHTTNEEAQTSNSASSSQHEQKNNEIIQDVIDTSSLKEEDITSLSVASSSSHKTNEEVIADFLNNSNLSILLTAMIIFLIILSILSYTKMKQTI
ncbi:hypothetical protein NEIRO03_2363 [Nematocida sp. AWRm78]|nr:hypothetical protein NEIRO02_2346 [Nematocida sp. AWRm79]KAI5186699.1 hypothetical protein NEIRO03_2363 [Nematocida sp. AWRm78]